MLPLVADIIRWAIEISSFGGLASGAGAAPGPVVADMVESSKEGHKAPSYWPMSAAVQVALKAAKDTVGPEMD